MKKNKILPYILALGLIVLLIVLTSVFFRTVFMNRDAPKTDNTPTEKLSGKSPISRGEKPIPPQRIESRLSGKILSVKSKIKDEGEFTLLDESLKKEFAFRVSPRAQISTETIDTEKNIITTTVNPSGTVFSNIKSGAYATVVTIDPLDARGPLQALRVTVSKPPSKKQ